MKERGNCIVQYSLKVTGQPGGDLRVETPTRQIYDALQHAYDHFNKALFAGQLPQVIFVLQRSTKSMGHVSTKRWQNHQGRQIDELSVNPEFFLGRAILEIFSTLCHEMCHIWRENVSTEECGRRFYHDKVWARQMERIGLVPSDTGMPGGNKTGQKMGDYPLVDSAFYVASMRLVYSNYMLPWVDMRPNRLSNGFAVYNRKGEAIDYSNRDDRLMMSPIGYQPPDTWQWEGNEQLMDEIAQDANAIIASIFGRPVDSTLLIGEDEDARDEIFAEQIQAFSATANLTLSSALLDGFNFTQQPVFEEKKQTRIKYTCGCDNNVWGRAGLNITCNACHALFEAVLSQKPECNQEATANNDEMELQMAAGFPYSMEELEEAFDQTFGKRHTSDE